MSLIVSVRPNAACGVCCKVLFLVTMMVTKVTLYRYSHVLIYHYYSYCHFNFYSSLNKDNRQMMYCTNVSETIEPLDSGVYTMSNERLDSPWAKQVEGRKKFESIISQADGITKECLTDKLIELLCDSTWLELEETPLLIQETLH